MTDKRNSGQLDSKGNYLVINESDRQPDDGWIHKPCGAEIMGANVAITIRHPMMPLAGSGEVRTHIVPYCPNCEKKATHGTAIAGQSRINITTWED